METNLLDRMLGSYLNDQVPITLTLQNKIRVTGRIKAFDSYVIIMDGKKREIIYRHAVSCLAPSDREEQKQPSVLRTARTKPAPVPAKYPSQTASKPKPTKPAPIAASASLEPGISNTMKEGLMKWMQEQKAPAK